MYYVDITADSVFAIDLELVSDHDLSLVIHSEDSEGMGDYTVRIRFDTPGLALERLANAIRALAIPDDAT